MSDLVQFQEHRQLTAADMRAQVNLVQEVMKAVMLGPSKENPAGVHYGVIPGTKKPSLYKAGAEVLCATFRIADKYEITDLTVDGMARFRVRCVGTHQTTGIVLGEGIGECSSHEEKYKWRAAICSEEFEVTPDNMRRLKFSSWDGRVTKKQQVRTESADQANTILKMACKRAKIAMTLNVTAASDIFTQDVEDLPPELRHEEAPIPGPQPKKAAATQDAPDRQHQQSDAPDPEPAAAPTTPGNGSSEVPLTAGAVGAITAKMQRAKIDAADFEKRFSCKLEVGAKVGINRVMAWIKDPVNC